MSGKIDCHISAFHRQIVWFDCLNTLSPFLRAGMAIPLAALEFHTIIPWFHCMLFFSHSMSSSLHLYTHQWLHWGHHALFPTIHSGWLGRNAREHSKNQWACPAKAAQNVRPGHWTWVLLLCWQREQHYIQVSGTCVTCCLLFPLLSNTCTDMTRIYSWPTLNKLNKGYKYISDNSAPWQWVVQESRLFFPVKDLLTCYGKDIRYEVGHCWVLVCHISYLNVG